MAEGVFKHHSVAVKEMKRTDNQEEQKRLFTDLEVITKCNDCEQIVRCCGYILTAVSSTTMGAHPLYAFILGLSLHIHGSNGHMP